MELARPGAPFMRSMSGVFDFPQSQFGTYPSISQQMLSLYPVRSAGANQLRFYWTYTGDML